MPSNLPYCVCTSESNPNAYGGDLGVVTVRCSQSKQADGRPLNGARLIHETPQKGPNQPYGADALNSAL